MIKNKKGFTLVELLAVIVILAIILVIAVPQIIKTIDESREGALSSSAKLIAASAEREYLVRQTLGDTTFTKISSIPCEDVIQLTEDYESCSIKFTNGKASVTLEGTGKFEGKNVCSGTRTSASVTEEACDVSDETVGCDTLTWDGTAKDGIIVSPDDEPLYYVSDVILTGNDLSNSYTIGLKNDVEILLEEKLEGYEQFGNAILLGVGFSILEDDTSHQGMVFPKKGFYCSPSLFEVVEDEEAVFFLTIPGYTGFPHSKNCGH